MYLLLLLIIIIILFKVIFSIVSVSLAVLDGHPKKIGLRSSRCYTNSSAKLLGTQVIIVLKSFLSSIIYTYECVYICVCILYMCYRSIYIIWRKIISREVE